jgi:hypothetical protein
MKMEVWRFTAAGSDKGGQVHEVTGATLPSLTTRNNCPQTSYCAEQVITSECLFGLHIYIFAHILTECKCERGMAVQFSASINLLKEKPRRYSH